MFKFVILAVCVFASSAQAGVLTGVLAAPAIGAPLVGRVTTHPAETTIVKQQYVVDQPEIRYHSVPTVVQTAPIVKTVQPVVHAYAAAPAVVRTVPAWNSWNYAGLPAATYAAW